MEIIGLGVVGLLIVISPGADFILVLRNCIHSGRRSGILTACGISLAIGIHISYSILGIGYLISQNDTVFKAINYLGAIYLIYLGAKSFLTANDKVESADKSSVNGKPSQYFMQGFVCNLLNPKTMLFFISLFSQLVSSDPHSNSFIFLYGLYIAVLHGVWFSLVSLVFTSKTLQDYIGEIKKGKIKTRLNQACGLGLVCFGILLSIRL